MTTTEHPLAAIRKALDPRFKSRAKFAAHADIDPTTLWAIETQNRNIGIEVLLKLVRATGQTEDQLRELLGQQVVAERLTA